MDEVRLFNTHFLLALPLFATWTLTTSWTEPIALAAFGDRALTKSWILCL